MKPGTDGHLAHTDSPAPTEALRACKTPSTEACTEYRSNLFRAFCPIDGIRSRFRASLTIASANAGALECGETIPVSSGTTKSGPQPTRSLTRHGRPQTIASFTTIPQVSPTEGRTRTSPLV